MTGVTRLIVDGTGVPVAIDGLAEYDIPPDSLQLAPLVLSEVPSVEPLWTVSVVNRHARLVPDDDADWVVVDSPVPSEVDRRFAFSDARRSLRLPYSDPVNTPRQIRRLVRSLVRGELLRAGGMPVHASAFRSAGGQGVLVVGRKLGGKTTTVLNAVFFRAACFSSNDDALLVIRDARLRAMAGPRFVNVRRATVRQLLRGRPALRSLLRSPAYEGGPVYNAADQKIVLTPTTIEQTSGHPVLSSIQVDVVLHTVYGEEWSIDPLTPHDVAALLTANVEPVGKYEERLNEIWGAPRLDALDLEAALGRPGVRLARVTQSAGTVDRTLDVIEHGGWPA